MSKFARTLLQIFVMNMPKMEHNAANSMHTVSLMLIGLIRIKLSSLNLIEYSVNNVLQYHRALVLKRTSCIGITIRYTINTIFSSPCV